jgi:RNA polymerase sigma-70 factor, ECF subfamily
VTAGAALVAATVADDAVDFEALYRAHFGFVWRALVRLGVPERDVADACQDVFVVVHERLARLDPRSRLTTFLYAVCLRMASDRRRRAAARYEVLGGEHELSVEQDPPVLSDRRALLAYALDQMPLEQRAVFTLFELEGMSGEEIATLLTVPVATVHSRLRLARDAFRLALRRAAARERFDLTRPGREHP